MSRTRSGARTVIALGSNLGDREANLRDAVRDIAAIEGVTVMAASGLVESHAVKPAGVDAAAPSYLNAVILVRSELTAEQLLEALHKIEYEHGRVRTERWGDRTLDLDIIVADGAQRQSESLTLPHPRAWERAFVLAPWLQLDPEAELPGRGRIAELLAGLSAEAPDQVWDYPAALLLDSVER
ncbi:MAG: 2-amino-4-hydroxy-6-hydroxymethyldihydropteridine diphosphokinase [Lacisediminihabitans sp.]